MKKVLAVILLALTTQGVGAQELNCQVSVIFDNKLEVSTVEQEIFQQLEQVIYDLMNTRKWTKDNFEVEERINCNLQLQIRTIPSSGTYSGYLQIQSSRPAFNASYNTTLFNYQDDDITFSFTRGAAVRYAEAQFTDNLSSLLAFYAYYIIGMDYDSFSSDGGTEYFEKAREVVSLAQSSGLPGWKSNEQGKRNRYWLVDNILHELFAPLRDCNYLYHRNGIDKLYEDKIAARSEIYSALNKLIKVVAARPNSLNLLNFIQAKTTELKNLYEDAEARDKNNIVNLLKRIDPTNSSKYQEILG
ncbi:MAG: hypothetical protein ACI865_001669 [Flavobacteriaceae bacterium]|jgi:hypothetical protein